MSTHTAVIEVKTNSANQACNEAILRTMLSLCRDHTVRVHEQQVRYVAARQEGNKLCWLLECTVKYSV